MNEKSKALVHYSLEQLQKMPHEELNPIAEKLQIKDYEKLDTPKLIYTIIDQQAIQASLVKSTKTNPKKEAPAKATKPKPRTQNKKAEGAEKPRSAAKEAKPTPRPAPPAAKKKEAAPERKEEPKKPAFSLMDLSIPGIGVLEVMPDNYGFLRSPDYNYLASPDDTYVSHTLIKQLGLRTGDTIQGLLRPPRDGEKYFGLLEIEKVNGKTVKEIQQRVGFEYLTSLFPQEKLNIICPGQQPFGTRFVDLFSPIGKGQRGMIVAQPKTGKTFLLKDIANGIAKNHPEVYLMILLIGERPEEVTDMQRSVDAEVVSSTFMQPADEQVKVAEMAIEKAKRLAECNTDVVILLDSITRLARAFNASERSSGKTGTGGIEYVALKKTQELFGTGNNLEKGGSVTILATALVETGSKMDDIIFEELKGTGNMELQLARGLANRGIFPAIDIIKSSTRRNELMQSEETAKRLRVLRQVISEMSPQEAIEFVIKNMKDTNTNDDFISSMYQKA